VRRFIEGAGFFYGIMYAARTLGVIYMNLIIRIELIMKLFFEPADYEYVYH
jgi:hypothetical protein